MTRPIMLAMDAVDEQQEMAARTLGAGPIKIALAITLPLTYRGILAGIMLGFIRALSEFGATITVAGNIPGKTQTLALAIYSNVQLREDAAAFRLIGVSIVLTVVTLLIYNWLLRQAGKQTARQE
jgi:molybdate transport system permease protein